MIEWNLYNAAIYRPSLGALKPIRDIDPVSLDDLVGIEAQKAKLVQNTHNFMHGAFSNNVLMWGSRGMGKSTLMKALLNAYAPQGLRVVEFFQEDLQHLPEIIDALRHEPYRFIIFLDDLSFERANSSYIYLKSAMEGSIESPPQNVRLYATSNRRHLVDERHSDNQGVEVKDGELHYGDVVEEKLSLADRFGLWISFYQGTQEDYLAMVEHYFKEIDINRDTLHVEAKRFSALRASRSGRTAKQFYLQYMQQS